MTVNMIETFKKLSEKHEEYKKVEKDAIWAVSACLNVRQENVRIIMGDDGYAVHINVHNEKHMQTFNFRGLASVMGKETESLKITFPHPYTLRLE